MDSRSGTTASYQIISYYTGYVVLCISILMFIPIFTAVLFSEWIPLLDFLISIAVAVIIGTAMILLGWKAKVQKANIQWKHGYIIAALSWVLLMILCAVPYFLSGHVGSFLPSFRTNKLFYFHYQSFEYDTNAKALKSAGR